MIVETGSSTLAAYFDGRGWNRTHRESSATIWALGADETRQIAVSNGVRIDSFEWSDILRRIADIEERAESSVIQEFKYAGFDRVRFRIANDGIIGDTVPFHSGADFLSSTYSMLRATATTAQRPRGQIAGAYSKIGDEHVRAARLAHTEQGSFIVPVLFRHDAAVTPSNVTPIAGMDPIVRESPQRRIVRTLAETMDTYNKRIIQPGKEVRLSALTSVVAAGGSRELFASLERILNDDTVAEFETQFAWGLALPAATGSPRSVRIPAEARELVTQTVAILTEERTLPLRIFTGPVVAVDHEPDDPLVRIALQTPSSNGRMSRVYMNVRKARLSEIAQWIEGSMTITVQGVVARRPGGPLELEGIANPMSLADSFLSTDPD
jgi:hypothetical protein